MGLIGFLKNWQDVVEFPEDSVIFREREAADAAYVILKGEVELSLRGELLGVEGEGGVFGEMATIEPSTRNTTARTMTPVELARLDRNALVELVSKHPEFAMELMAVLANRLRSVDAYISRYLEKDLDPEKF